MAVRHSRPFVPVLPAPSITPNSYRTWLPLSETSSPSWAVCRVAATPGRGAGAGRANRLPSAEQLGPGRPAHVPDQAQASQQADQVVADVHLPPEEALVGAALVVVVVVVPALTQGQHGHHHVVPALVAGGVAPPPPQVA